jgi:hypothetical protein
MTAEILRYTVFPAGDRGGNPAGVVLDAHGMTDEEMLAAAADVGFSETAFLFPSAWTGGRRRASARRAYVTSVRARRCRSAVTPPSRPPSPTPSATAPAASTS